MFVNNVFKVLHILFIVVFITACASDKNSDVTTNIDTNNINKPNINGLGIPINKLGFSIRNVDLEKVDFIQLKLGDISQFDTKIAEFDVLNETIFYLNTSGEIYSYNILYNKKIWQNKIELSKSPLFRGYIKIVDKIVIVFGNNGITYGLDIKNGNVLWKIDLDSNINSKPSVYLNNLIFQLVGGKTVSINSQDGKIVWQHSLIFENETSYLEVPKVIIDKNIAYILYANGNLFAINAKNGHQYWSSKLTNNLSFDSVVEKSSFITPVIVDKNNIYVISNNKGFYVINSKTGFTKWRKNILSAVNIIVTGDIVFILDINSKVWAIDKKDGFVYWTMQLQQLYNGVQATWNNMILHNGKLVLFSSTGKIQLLSIDNGNTIALHNVKNGNLKIVKKRNLVYMLQDNGNLKVYR